MQQHKKLFDSLIIVLLYSKPSCSSKLGKQQRQLFSSIWKLARLIKQGKRKKNITEMAAKMYLTSLLFEVRRATDSTISTRLLFHETQTQTLTPSLFHFERRLKHETTEENNEMSEARKKCQQRRSDVTEEISVEHLTPLRDTKSHFCVR